ncbi:MAG: ABC transporter permease [Candidatus Parvarchaeota archaeon]
MKKETLIYIGKRIILFPIIIFVVVSINFILIHLAPGGPFAILLSNPAFTPQEVANLEKEYGLNKPLVEQYFIYIYQVMTGNLGISYFYGISVTKIFFEYLPNTLVLASFSLILSSTVGIVLGIFAAMRKGITDKAFNVVSITSYTTPVFWQGIMMILIFSVYLRWFPSTGNYITVGSFNLLEYLWHLVLPVVSLSLLLYPPIFFFTRSNLLAIMQKDFIKALYAKGLRERLIFTRHALKNSLLPVVTLIGLHSTILFGGAAVVEIVFSWPGIGLLTYTAILNKDYPLMLGSIFFYGLLVAGVNLIVDLAYLAIDPRINIKR